MKDIHGLNSLLDAVWEKVQFWVINKSTFIKLVIKIGGWGLGKFYRTLLTRENHTNVWKKGKGSKIAWKSFRWHILWMSPKPLLFLGGKLRYVSISRTFSNKNGYPTCLTILPARNLCTIPKLLRYNIQKILLCCSILIVQRNDK